MIESHNLDLLEKERKDELAQIEFEKIVTDLIDVMCYANHNGFDVDVVKEAIKEAYKESFNEELV